MDLKDLLQLASNFGFAALVAFYVLWRIEPILSRLVAIEAAELELVRLGYVKELGKNAVDQVLSKHGLAND